MKQGVQGLLFLLLAVQAKISVTEAAMEFPKMDMIIGEFFQAEVQVTDQDQDTTAFATEYYDMSQGRGRLDIMVYGEPLSLFYYNLTGDILEVKKDSCIVSTEELSDFYYTDAFFGWLHKNPLIIGPSALLWYAQDFKPDYIGVKEVKGIQCDFFELTINDKMENVIYGYYFAVDDWSMPYQANKKKNTKVPVRITMQGSSSRETENHTAFAPIDEVVDFSYIRPTINSVDLHPEIGLGCFGRATEFMLPKIPLEFRLEAEMYDLLAAENREESEAVFTRLFFSNYTQLARLDTDKQDRRKSHLYDFRNGVAYTIENGMTCQINPLRNALFEEYDGLNGHIKTPREVLGLNGEFYFMGERKLRGMNCRVFESAQRHTSLDDEEYYLLVTTVYFSDSFTKSMKDGEDMTQVPVYIRVTGYSQPSKVTLKVQHNIFGFDDIVGPTIFDGFAVQDCFPMKDQRSYFILSSPVDVNIARQLENNNQLVANMVRNAIVKATNISYLRLPFVKADYHPSGVDIVGLMLDRPPVLSQFWLQYYGPSRADVTKRDANTKELCAAKCIEESEFVCRGIHFCGGFCYLNELDVFEETTNAGVIDLGVCEVYIRAILNLAKQEPALPKALEILSNTTISIDVPLQNVSILVRFPEVQISSGVFSKEATEKSYDLVFYGMRIPSKSDSMATVEVEDITTENDCYRACKEDTSIDCESFSYCPTLSTSRCRISSMVTSKDMTIKFGDLENNKDCNLFSLMNLDYFTPLPGRVTLITGNDVLVDVSVEECSVNCRRRKDFKCRGFEFCREGRICVLHSKHIIEYKTGQLVETTEKCTHYAAKFSADYRNMGDTLVDENFNKRGNVLMEECARACSEEFSGCQSFSYCPKQNEYSGDSSCSFSTKTLETPGVKVKIDPRCRLYTKRESVENYGGLRKAPVDANYSKGGFVGVVLGTLIFGLIVGAGAFIGYSFYRSRKYNDGMSVRFMKQTDS